MKDPKKIIAALMWPILVLVYSPKILKLQSQFQCVFRSFSSQQELNLVPGKIKIVGCYQLARSAATLKSSWRSQKSDRPLKLLDWQFEELLRGIRSGDRQFSSRKMPNIKVFSGKWPSDLHRANSYSWSRPILIILSWTQIFGLRMSYSDRKK